MNIMIATAGWVIQITRFWERKDTLVTRRGRYLYTKYSGSDYVWVFLDADTSPLN